MVGARVRLAILGIALVMGAAGCSPTPSDSCAGMVCNDPPADTCQGVDSLLVYGTTGVCVAGRCEYTAYPQACPAGCRDGVCLGDSCLVTGCSEPPAAECEGNAALVYPAQGVCDPSSLQCLYTPERRDCPFGCQAGACMVCAVDGDCGASPPVCLDDHTVQLQEPSCLAGACREEPVQIDCAAAGQVCEAGVCATGLRRPVAGDLVITEFMANPAVVSDTAGEWFEFRSLAAETLELSGLRVGDDRGVAFTLSPGASFPLEPGRYLVLGANGDPGLNGGVPVDYDYGGFSLVNSADEILLSGADDALLDAVRYDAAAGWSILSGVSLRLLPEHADPAANDLPANWCPSAEAYSADNRGSPGSAGTGCAGCETADDCQASPAECLDGDWLRSFSVDCLAGQCVQQVVDTDCSAAGQVCRQGVCLGIYPAAGPGDLVICEFMANPHAVGDTAGEWIELVNTSGRTLDLVGLTVRDDGSQRFQLPADRSFPLAAGGFFLLAVEAESSLNGGLKPDYAYSGLTLVNGADAIVLETAAGALIDAVRYDAAAGWPIADGASAQLLQRYFYPDANDDPGHWCLTASTYGAGDRGTPGTANTACASRLK